MRRAQLAGEHIFKPEGGWLQESIKRGDKFRVVRVNSWIVSVRSGNTEDPRIHTKQHERALLTRELDLTF
jgi:hypothetical protein